MDRGAWRATVCEVTRVGHDLATEPNHKEHKYKKHVKYISYYSMYTKLNLLIIYFLDFSYLRFKWCKINLLFFRNFVLLLTNFKTNKAFKNLIRQNFHRFAEKHTHTEVLILLLVLVLICFTISLD